MKLARSLGVILGMVFPALAGVAMTEIRGEDWDLSNPMNGVTFQRAKVITEATADKTTLRYSHLHNVKGRTGLQSPTLSAMREATHIKSLKTSGSYTNISAVDGFSNAYEVRCAWDGKLVSLLFDTGSSDTWAVKNDFKCEDTSGIGYSQSQCAFGKPWLDDFGHGEIPGMHFFVRYGSGQQISGPMGYSDIACGGLLVSEQQVGLANKTYWRGDNQTVGILGLAYPSITSGYYGAVGEETPASRIPYVPFFTSAVSQGTIDPVFSIALERNSSKGLLGWGGIPPGPWQTEKFARADLIVANLINQANTAWQHSFYTIIPDGAVWGRTTDTTKYPYLVDSGTMMMYMPGPLAEQIAKAFQPEAVYMYQYDKYFAPCDAIPPRLGIVISGMKFWTNPADMIIQEMVDLQTGYCAVAVASGGEGPFILGAAFLQNVLAVFDVGAAEMRFYPRE